MLSEIQPKANYSILRDDIIPDPFNLNEELNSIDKHHRRQRRMSTCCDDRYILFVLDTSGSIGNTTFAYTVESLSNLSSMFCKKAKIAAISFGSHIYHEFCFNCFGNDDEFRDQLKNAISSIPYRGGTTNTGRALKCVCDKILTTACGLPNKEKYKECPAPIDVVVLTDGDSNGPLDVCQAAKCLHDQELYDVNTFAIGLNNFNHAELDCIVDQHNLDVKNIFYMEDFDEFHELIDAVIEYLSKNDPNGQPRTCYNPNKLL